MDVPEDVRSEADFPDHTPTPTTPSHMEKAMAPHSSALAWKSPWTEELGRLQSMGLLRAGTIERLHFHFSLSCIGEGNGNPLQCSCLENSRDERAWWAAIYGVAQSQTRLKQLSSSNSSHLIFIADPTIPVLTNNTIIQTIMQQARQKVVQRKTLF